jgi:NAD(P)H-flavin reductase
VARRVPRPHRPGFAPWLKQPLKCRTPAPAALFFSARTERDLIDEERFRGWQRRHPGFCYLCTLTRADGPPPTGRIPAILGDWFPDLSGWRVNIARRARFVTAGAATARAGGARPGRVRTQEFFAEPQPWGAAQPAVAAYDREPDLHQDRP